MSHNPTRPLSDTLAEILNDEWAAAPPDPEETGDRNWSVVANRVPYIAKVYEPHGAEIARLITSAPALLEALENLLTATQPQHTLSHVFIGEAQEAARAAINLARGAQ